MQENLKGAVRTIVEQYRVLRELKEDSRELKTIKLMLEEIIKDQKRLSSGEMWKFIEEGWKEYVEINLINIEDKKQVEEFVRWESGSKNGKLLKEILDLLKIGTEYSLRVIEGLLKEWDSIKESESEDLHPDQPERFI